MKWKRRTFVTILLVLAWPVLWIAIRGAQVWLHGGPSRIKVSPAITHVVEPLDAEGFVDYVAALNQLYRDGLPADRNAAVWLLRAVGPKVLETQPPEKFYALLGMEPLPAAGNYFVTMEETAERHTSDDGKNGRSDDWELLDTIYSQWDLAISGPWRPEQCPLIDEWLEANQEPLNNMIRASQQDQYYFPLVFDDKPRREWVLNYFPPLQDSIHKLYDLVMIRSMRQLANDDLAGALADMVVGLRIGRLLAQSYETTEVMAGENLEVRAYGRLNQAMRDRPLDREQIGSLLKQFDKLPQRQSRWRMIDRSARLSALFTYTAYARLGFDDQIFDEPRPFGPTASQIDWNLVLRLTNEAFDSIVAKVRADEEPNTPTTEATSRTILDLSVGGPASDARLSQLRRQARLPWGLAATSELFAVETFRFAIVGETSVSTRSRSEAYFELSRLALILEDFRLTRGNFPEQLVELVPDWIAELPIDRFSADERLIYRRNEEGCMVYIGNGPDEWGEAPNEASASAPSVSLPTRRAAENDRNLDPR